MRAGQGTTLRQMDWEGESAWQRLDKAPVEESASRGGEMEESGGTWNLMAWGQLPLACGIPSTLK